MKQLFKYLCGALLSAIVVAACAELPELVPESIETTSVAIDRNAPSFHAGIVSDSVATKTYLDGTNNLHWTADDRVSIFCATTENLEYVFCGNTGDKTGELNKVLDDKTPGGKNLSANYGIYPYSESTSISESGVITYEFPSTQTYCAKSFGLKANTMVAVSGGKSDFDLKFKNVGGYLVFSLYGNMTVKSVTITGANGEKISGKADITVSSGGAPSVQMHSDASSSLTIDCGQGVKVGSTSDKATEFWFVLPPVTFSKGLSVTVTGTDGKRFVRSTATRGSITRNSIVKVNAFTVQSEAGKFVRLRSKPETFDMNTVMALAKERGIDISSYKSLIDLGMDILDLDKTLPLILNRVVYTTTDRNGNIVEASGLISYPQKLKSYSKILSVQHVTCNIDEAPSSMDTPYEIAVAAKEGVEITTLADYPGYGVSETADLQSPYMHSHLTGTACADLIKAAKEFLNGKVKMDKTPTVDLIGYSQGAAATISTLEVLESRIADKTDVNTIGEVRVGAGPYDLEAFLNRFIKAPNEPFESTGYLAFVIRGLIYGDNLDVDEHNIYAPYIFNQGIYDKFSTQQVSRWHNLIGTDVKNVFHPDFFASNYNGSADVQKAMQSARNNSTIHYNGKYKSKIKMFHSKNDDVVPYDQSPAAQKAWGCSSVTNLEKSAHDKAGIEFYVKYGIGYYEADSITRFVMLDPLWEIVSDLL